MSQIEQPIETIANIENRLIYGAYPEIVLSKDNKSKEMYLKEIVSSYLYKDILEFEGLRHPDKLIRSLQLLSFQIGKEVYLNEIGGQLAMRKIQLKGI